MYICTYVTTVEDSWELKLFTLYGQDAYGILVNQNHLLRKQPEETHLSLYRSTDYSYAVYVQCSMKSRFEENLLYSCLCRCSVVTH